LRVDSIQFLLKTTSTLAISVNEKALHLQAIHREGLFTYSSEERISLPLTKEAKLTT